MAGKQHIQSSEVPLRAPRRTRRFKPEKPLVAYTVMLTQERKLALMRLGGNWLDDQIDKAIRGKK